MLHEKLNLKQENDIKHVPYDKLVLLADKRLQPYIRPIYLEKDL